MKNPSFLQHVDDRFTDLADAISTSMGKWPIVTFFAASILLWTIYCIITQGSGWWYGTYYNLPLNLITTVIELFCECFILAAANRVERRNAHLLACLLELVQKVDAVVERREQAELLPDAER